MRISKDFWHAFKATLITKLSDAKPCIQESCVAGLNCNR